MVVLIVLPIGFLFFFKQNRKTLWKEKLSNLRRESSHHQETSTYSVLLLEVCCQYLSKEEDHRGSWVLSRGASQVASRQAEKMEAIINSPTRRSCINKALLVFALVVTTVSAATEVSSGKKTKDGWTVRQLLTQHFPHRISDDIYLDPCKAGRKYVNQTIAEDNVCRTPVLVFSVFLFCCALPPSFARVKKREKAGGRNTNLLLLFLYK